MKTKASTKWTAGPVTKSAWVPGPVRWRKPRQSHMKTMWTLFGISTLLLAAWLVGLATQHFLNGWIHAFVVGSVVMGAVSLVYGFKYCEYLERPFMKRVRNAKFFRSRKNPPPEESLYDARRKP